MTTRTFTLKQNAKRAALKAGLPAEMVYETEAGYAFDLPEDTVPYAINDGINSAGEPAVREAADEGGEIPAFLKTDRAATAAALEEVAPTIEPTVGAEPDAVEAEEMDLAAAFEAFLAASPFAQGAELKPTARELAEAAFAAGFAAAHAQAKPARKARKPRENTGGPSKKDIVAGLLTRAEGCTTRDILDATGWPSVSVPALAKSADLNLRQEKDGRVTRYYGNAA